MNLLCDRSDFLLQSVGGRPDGMENPDGVVFTWAGHCLVYGWIPEQCIVTKFTLARFRDICEDRNIRPCQYILVWSDLCLEILLIRNGYNITSIDPFTPLEDPDASIGSIQERLKSLGI